MSEYAQGDNKATQDIFGPARNEPEVDFTELNEIVNNLITEREKMHSKEPIEKVQRPADWPKPTSGGCNIPYEPPTWPLQQNPQFVSPIMPTTKYVEFIAWLKGYLEASHSSNAVKQQEYEMILNKLEELEL